MAADAADAGEKISIVVEFSGGLEMLFSDQRRHALSIPAVNKDGKPATIAFLIDYLCENTMKDSRKELFVLDGHLGIVIHAAPILFISAASLFSFPILTPTPPSTLLA
ncbi:ubiquitin-related modifier 1 [Colletotrichum higginsianum]|nr:ubiquitin-related modifier 1 [Colletotrichum higginsianum]